jgi:hypothetical protein
MNKLDSLCTLLPQCNNIFIAGGAAVSFDLATDIDVWFGEQQRKVAEEWIQEMQKLGSIFLPGDGQVYDNGEVLGNLWYPKINKPIQVILNALPSMNQCLESFDISTHMRAYTSKGVEVLGSKHTPPNLPPKILRQTKKTFQRYIKICLRYGHTPDILTLQALVNGGFKKKIPMNSIDPFLQYMNMKKTIDTNWLSYDPNIVTVSPGTWDGITFSTEPLKKDID